MKIAFLCSEYFHYRIQDGRPVPSSAHGGFGYLTRKKAEGLSRLGHDVHALIPAASFDARRNIAGSYRESGVTVHLYPHTGELEWRGYRHVASSVAAAVWAAARSRIPTLEELMRSLDADVYVSENPSLSSCTVSPQQNNHVLIFQDPWSTDDMGVLTHAAREYLEFVGVVLPPVSPVSGSPLPFYDYLTNWLGNALLERYLRSVPSEFLFGEASCISDRARRLYGLRELPRVLPNPIDVPDTLPEKSSAPTVCWIGRWDPQKRVDVALEVARRCPEIEFYFVGAPTERPDLMVSARALEERYARFPNIHVRRFVTEEEKQRILNSSWVLLNTSVREGLPLTFLEAPAHGVSIVAAVDPDEYTSKFGRYVSDGDFVSAVRESVRSEDFRTNGRRGYEHVRRVHETGLVVRQHLAVLKELASEARAKREGTIPAADGNADRR